MAMDSGGLPTIPGRSDHLAGIDPVARLHQKLLAVRVPGLEALPVVAVI